MDDDSGTSTPPEASIPGLERTDSGRGESKDFPVIQLDDALEIARRVKELGDSADMAAMERILGIRGGALARKLASTRRWGLVEGKGRLKLTNLAKDIFFYVTDDQPAAAKIRAFLGVPMFKELYETFSREGVFPRDDILRNLVIAKYGLDDRDASTVTNILKRSVSTFIPLLRPNTPVLQSHPPAAQSQPQHQYQQHPPAQYQAQQGQPLFQQVVNPGRPVEPAVPNPQPQVSGPQQPLMVPRQSVDSWRLYQTSLCLGRMVEMARNSEKIRPTKEEMYAVIQDTQTVSAGYSRLNFVLKITMEELRSGTIDVLTSLKRLKFFAQSLEEDCAITPPEGQADKV